MHAAIDGTGSALAHSPPISVRILDRVVALRRLLVFGAALALMLGAWALWYSKTSFLPSPSAMWNTLRSVLQTQETYSDLLATARRLVIGLVFGYGGGVMLSLIMHYSSWWQRFFTPYVFVLLTTPSLALALFSLTVFGLSETGVYVSVAGIVLPFVVVSMREGLTTLNRGLSQMTTVYAFSRYQRIRHRVLPEIAPHMLAALRNVHALAWKIVVIAELFSQQNGIGAHLERAYKNFDLSVLITWALFLVAMVILFEYGLLRPLERSVFRWRQPALNTQT